MPIRVALDNTIIIVYNVSIVLKGESYDTATVDEDVQLETRILHH